MSDRDLICKNCGKEIDASGAPVEGRDTSGGAG
jgi:hypothetical protein